MSKSRKMMSVVVIAIGLLLVIGASGIGCCKCLSWNPVTISWTGSSPGTWNGNCGGSPDISWITLGTAVSLNSSINCSPNCQPSYSWSISTSGTTPQVTWTGVGMPASFTPASAGCFAVNLNASCGSNKCRPCQLKICIKEILPTPCTSIFSACVCDNFTSPGEYPTPSIALLDWIDVNYATRNDTNIDSEIDIYGATAYNKISVNAPKQSEADNINHTAKDNELVDELRGTRDCDDNTTTNKYWATTFSNLAPPAVIAIQSAKLTIHVYNGDTNFENDTLALGFISTSTSLWAWSEYLGPPTPSTTPNFGINTGHYGTIQLDLSALPIPSGTPTNLLGQLTNNGFLDVVVQDDSGVDCATLEVTYICSP
jgi:hypothetical protein